MGCLCSTSSVIQGISCLNGLEGLALYGLLIRSLPVGVSGTRMARTDEFHEFSQVYSPHSQICAIRVERAPFFEKAMQVQDVTGLLPAKVPSS